MNSDSLGNLGTACASKVPLRVLVPARICLVYEERVQLRNVDQLEYNASPKQTILVSSMKQEASCVLWITQSHATQKPDTESTIAGFHHETFKSENQTEESGFLSTTRPCLGYLGHPNRLHHSLDSSAALLATSSYHSL